MTIRPNATATDRFMGKCKVCALPASVVIADAAGDKTTARCARCSATVTLKRLYAVKTQTTCNGKCMTAMGPSCSCSCGGENHGGRVNIVTTYSDAETLAAIDAHHAKQDARRAAAAERAANRARVRFEEWTAGGNADVVEYLAGVDLDAASQFVFDMAKMARQYKPLSPRQADAVRRCAAWDAERKANAAKRAAERQARAAAGVAAPSGKQTVTGTVVSVKLKDTDFGSAYKMLVRLDSGATVWGTVPRSIADVNKTTVNNLLGLRDVRIKLTATFQPSRDDKTFGYVSRPTAVLI